MNRGQLTAVRDFALLLPSLTGYYNLIEGIGFNTPSNWVLSKVMQPFPPLQKGG